MKLRLALVCIALTTGCHARVMRQVRDRAALEFHCPEGDVLVTRIGPDQYGARGCGRALSCQDVPFAGLLCDARGQPPPPPMDAGS